MKIFISWSGDRSLAIAKALRDWLPRVIQAVQPWLSESDIGKGTRWEREIGAELAQTRFGIICLTPENLDARWINFEAGALSKTIERTYVCTYLQDLKPTDIEGPLSQFNHTRVDKEDSRKLIHAINRALEAQTLDKQIVDDAFDLLWPRLAERLNQLPAVQAQHVPTRETDDMVEEILELVRAQSVERARNSLSANRLLTTLLPLIATAMRNDPNFQPSTEFLEEMQKLELDAHREEMTTPRWHLALKRERSSPLNLRPLNFPNLGSEETGTDKAEDQPAENQSKEDSSK